jgi:hypothetical protein
MAPRPGTDKGLAADAELARERGFWLAGTGAAAHLEDLVVRQRFLGYAEKVL